MISGRFGDHNLNKNFLYQRAIEIVGRRYQLAYPKMEYNKARNVKYVWHGLLVDDNLTSSCVKVFTPLLTTGRSWC